MRALGEVVSAVPVTKVAVLPRLLATDSRTGQDGFPVDKDLDGPHVASEVVGLVVGGGKSALQDRP